MPASLRRPGDQSYDGLIVRADLPDGWHLASRFPGERDDDASAQAIVAADPAVVAETFAYELRQWAFVDWAALAKRNSG